MKYFFLSLLLFSLPGYAQKKQNVYFLKAERIVSSKDSADYIRIIQEPDSGSTNFLLFEYYLDNTKKAMGFVSKYEPKLIYEHSLITFYKNGQRKNIVFYEKGVPTGNAYYYHPNGQLKKKIVYIKEEGTGKTPGDGKSKHKLLNYYDSTGVELVKDGTGYVKEMEGEGNLVEEGSYVEGVKDGLWKGRFINSNNSFEEQYQKGIFLSGEAFLASGETRKYAKMEELPEFEGGMREFYRYVAQNYRYPAEARRMKVTGKVVLSFVVEKDGSIADIKVVRDLGMGTGEEAVRVLQSAPKWIPGKQHGLPVRVAYSLPITLNLSR